jgi:hypothetical protein
MPSPTDRHAALALGSSLALGLALLGLALSGFDSRAAGLYTFAVGLVTALSAASLAWRSIRLAEEKPTPGKDHQ